MFYLYPRRLLPHRHGDLIERAQDEEPDGPDAKGDQGLGHGRPVGVDLFERIRHEAADDEPESLVVLYPPFSFGTAG